MEEEYYKPQEEDIHIGYECEMSVDSKNWRKVVLRKQDFVPFSWYDHHEERPTYREVQFRTPYLTENQILEEGWQIKEELNRRRRFEKDDVRLYFYPEKHVIRLVKIDFSRETTAETGFLDDFIVSFACPSINEFRKICKLLKIER